MQLTVRKLFELYPDALVMQADEASFAMNMILLGNLNRAKVKAGSPGLTVYHGRTNHG